MLSINPVFISYVLTLYIWCAGRGGSVFLVNAPVMLSLVMGAIRRVILCPAYNKGAMIEKGFLGQYGMLIAR